MVGTGAALAAGGLFLQGATAMADTAPQLAATTEDYARHLQNGDTAWADLDAATLAAQLSAGGADYFFTMGVLDVMMAIGDRAATGN
jgi:hypothetical protein